MRVVVFGATGNAGTSVLPALAGDPAVDEIVGVARRRPKAAFPKVTWAAADVTGDDLVPIVAGADVVVHLAWRIQPSHDERVLHDTNVGGSERILAAVAAARVPALVYASSVGAYSPGPKHVPVGESWPTNGIPTSFYARHKAIVERLLDRFEAEHPQTRVVRLRLALIFKREAGAEVARLFFGPLVPRTLLRRRLLPVVPGNGQLVFQAVHSLDVGEAYRLAVVGDVRGAFNIAADPVLDPPTLARTLGTRVLPVPPPVLRAAAAVTWRLRLQPTPPGWVDLAHTAPVMSTERARKELGWRPRFGADEALLDLLEGLHRRAGLDTPPLHPDRGGPVLQTRVPQPIERSVT
ncbi:MAG TPA: NAD-dependent epimerase/dehydratase family protein [Acidimicrobiales bacterium]|nr:NAD-dependent epimerase/dehydratase family protein [Acidimicrobiales bacterium]